MHEPSERSADPTPAPNRGCVLVCKVGLDGHDRGAKLLARLLDEEGFEVHYLGVRSTADSVGDAAKDLNADVVAVSLLSGAHVAAARAVRKALDDRGLHHVSLAMGGLIPQRDATALAEAGVTRCFCTGASESTPAAIPPALDELVSRTRRIAAEPQPC